MLCKKMHAANGASTYSIHFGKANIKELSLPPTNYKHYPVTHLKKERRTTKIGVGANRSPYFFSGYGAARKKTENQQR